MVERESGTIEDDAPVAPPIPSFASLRGPQRRSAVDHLFAPAEPGTERGTDVPEEPRDEAPARSTTAAPRPAEWGDLLALGTRLGACAVRLVAGGLTELRTRLRG